MDEGRQRLSSGHLMEQTKSVVEFVETHYGFLQQQVLQLHRVRCGDNIGGIRVRRKMGAKQECVSCRWVTFSVIVCRSRDEDRSSSGKSSHLARENSLHFPATRREMDRAKIKSDNAK